MKTYLNSLYNSLAMWMALPIMNVPLFCSFPLFKNKMVGTLVIIIGYIVLGFLVTALLHKLFGGVDYREVDQDRRLRGGCAMFVIQIPIAALCMVLIDNHPLWAWLLLSAFTILNFITAYFISKKYIIKT